VNRPSARTRTYRKHEVEVLPSDVKDWQQRKMLQPLIREAMEGDRQRRRHGESLNNLKGATVSRKMEEDKREVSEESEKGTSMAKKIKWKKGSRQGRRSGGANKHTGRKVRWMDGRHD